ncbi:MAG: leucine-rich repeat domain-containing protein [Candidatus Heimdallarchaeota archaeon]|nr:leucine-rich repeat domain-containing protein [Candidatus Heimdallarchaeota archaeon]
MDDRKNLKAALIKLGIENKYEEVLTKKNINGSTTKFENDKLIWVDLSNFGLTQLPEGVFDGLGSLQELKLYKNQISELPESIFDKLPELGEIHLKDNKLTNLRKRHFQNNPKLHRVFLLGNPLPGDVAKVFPTIDAVKSLIALLPE